MSKIAFMDFAQHRIKKKEDVSEARNFLTLRWERWAGGVGQIHSRVRQHELFLK